MRRTSARMPWLLASTLLLASCRPDAGPLVPFVSIDPPTGAHKQSDVTPPQLLALVLSQASVDVSAAPQTVTVDLDVTDNLSGVSAVDVFLASPSGTSVNAVAAPVSGTRYRARLVIPRYAAVGAWRIFVTLTDQVRNIITLTDVTLANSGLPSTITVTSTPSDVTPPTPASLAFSLPTVDVSAAPVVTRLQLRVTDDLSGVFVDPVLVSGFSFVLQSPSGRQQIRRVNPSFVVAGPLLDQTIEIPLEVPRYAETGQWTVQILRLSDIAGNVRFFTQTDLDGLGLTSRLTVTSATSDVTPPNLTGFSFAPAVINTSLGPQVVQAVMDATDDLSGVSFQGQTLFNRVFVISPSRQQTRTATQPDISQVGGTPLNGRWTATLTFPQFSEEGTWTVSGIRLEDVALNLIFVTGANIATLGFNPNLIVLRPSLSLDGQLASGGGTVQDSVFGARASITAPPGVLPYPVDMAIDVLGTPLSVPVPSGFLGLGTHYVNIQLAPNPSPLAAPGLTLVLPLPGLQPPGLALALQRLDPATGLLVPALDGGGTPIVGTVNAGGLSATFPGVTRFSTFVSLVPETIPVTIDVKPGSSTNSINLNGHGTTPVAVLASAQFSPNTLDLRTVRFAGAPPDRWSEDDVNRDGRADVVLHFSTRALKLATTDSRAVLTGVTRKGKRVSGSDGVQVVRE